MTFFSCQHSRARAPVVMLAVCALLAVEMSLLGVNAVSDNKTESSITTTEGSKSNTVLYITLGVLLVIMCALLLTILICYCEKKAKMKRSTIRMENAASQVKSSQVAPETGKSSTKTATFIPQSFDRKEDTVYKSCSSVIALPTPKSVILSSKREDKLSPTRYQTCIDLQQKINATASNVSAMDERIVPEPTPGKANELNLNLPDARGQMQVEEEVFKVKQSAMATKTIDLKLMSTVVKLDRGEDEFALKSPSTSNKNKSQPVCKSGETEEKVGLETASRDDAVEALRKQTANEGSLVLNSPSTSAKPRKFSNQDTAIPSNEAIPFSVIAQASVVQKNSSELNDNESLHSSDSNRKMSSASIVPSQVESCAKSSASGSSLIALSRYGPSEMDSSLALTAEHSSSTMSVQSSSLMSSVESLSMASNRDNSAIADKQSSTGPGLPNRVQQTSTLSQSSSTAQSTVL